MNHEELLRLALPPTDDSPPPVLADLLWEVEDYLRRYVVLSDEQAIAITLWVAHVFTFEAALTTPYLHVSSATLRSGKSRLLEVLDALLGEGRCIFTMNISPAALYRAIDANPGMALLMDESDRTMKGNKEKAEELFGLINSGYRRRGGYAIRVVGNGAAMKSDRFRTFSPKVIAGIGNLADTIVDRSISIRMHRRLPSEHIQRFREQDAQSATPTREALAAWATSETVSVLSAARPELPEELNDRAQDAWEPLFAIADLAASVWPKLARVASIALVEEHAEEALELLALSHFRDVFDEADEDRLASTSIVAAFVQRDDGPWAEWWGRDVADGKTIAPARRLARLVESYGVKPKGIRFGERVVRRYEREDFADAWLRYLPSSTATSATSATLHVNSVADESPVADHPLQATLSATPLSRDVSDVADVALPLRSQL